MSLENKVPYVEEIGKDGTVYLLVPADIAESVTKKRLEEVGLGLFVFLGQNGVIGTSCVPDKIRDTPYSLAFERIVQDELEGKLDFGASAQALLLFMNGEFEGSLWSERYMPRQDEA